MSDLYRTLTFLVAPLMPLWLSWRKWRGKEDRRRIGERYGVASVPRPKGQLLWLHAASVGEANSVLLLIEHIRARWPQFNILLTTGTVTSAQLMAKRLPAGVIHQYVPIDTPGAVKRFIRHWQPDIGFFVESEFWPNLIAAADASHCFLGVINARMSERSFKSWKKRPAMIAAMLKRFNIIFAQSEADQRRLQTLGAKNVICAGNLKYDAALLPCDEAELLALKQLIGGRPVWLAASTHAGEEAMVAQAHKFIATANPNLLTIVVPRHPPRGPEVARALARYGKTALRSKNESLAGATFYVADTLGELGLFYRLAPIVFMGGSLVSHGGQNPLEAARLACGVVTGPHTHNFAAVYSDLEAAGAVARVGNAATLAAQIMSFLGHSDALTAMQKNAQAWVNAQSGAAARVLDILAPVFNPKAQP